MQKLLSAIAVAIIGLTGTAMASTFGEYWDVQGNGAANTGTPFLGGPDYLGNVDSIIASRVADATFTSTGIAYPGPNVSGTTAQTLASFLGADAASLSAPVGSNSVLGTIFRLTGLVTLNAGNNVFDIYSDDGFRLTVGGTQVGSFNGLRAPSSSIVNVAGGAGGQVGFELIYFESQTVLAALSASLNGQIITGDMPAVPLPATLPLLAVGLMGFGAIKRRRRDA